MKKQFAFFKYLTFIIIILNSCTKDDVTILNENQAAINEIKKIVGDNGKIEVLSKNFNLEAIDIKSESTIDSNSYKYLSLSEFRQLYESIGKYQFERVVEKDSNSSIKSMDIDDDPRKPGLHRIKYYSFPFNLINGTYGINEAKSPLTILNLWFETNKQGRVIGTPTIFYSGVTFIQNWTQLYVTEIQYNASSNTSTFTIAGSTLYGVNIIGQNIGWTSKGGFNISINMSPSFGDDGDIRILGWK